MKIEIQDALDLVQSKIQVWFESAIAMFPNFIVALVVLILFFLFARLSKKLILKLNSRVQNNQAIISLLGNVVFLGILFLGIFAALSILQLNKTVTSLLAGAGIIGLALGFAFQETAANFLAGVLMAFRKPLRIGDLVGSNDQMGTVVDLNLRAITIKNLTGQIVYIPNKNVLYSNIVNYSKSGKRRMDLEVGVSYGENLAKVKSVTLEAIESLKESHKIFETHLWYSGFGDSSINFILAVWISNTSQGGYLELRSEVIMAIKKAFDRNDITIPFPIRTLDFGIKGGTNLKEMNLFEKGSTLNDSVD